MPKQDSLGGAQGLRRVCAPGNSSADDELYTFWL